MINLCFEKHSLQTYLHLGCPIVFQSSSYVTSFRWRDHSNELTPFSPLAVPLSGTFLHFSRLSTLDSLGKSLNAELCFRALVNGCGVLREVLIRRVRGVENALSHPSTNQFPFFCYGQTFKIKYILSPLSKTDVV